MPIQTPQNYLTYNEQQSKILGVVVDIEGAAYLTSGVIGRKFKYGDPETYGGGQIYGGLVPIGSNPDERQQKQLLELNRSSLQISQRLEPEQGRGSVSTLTMSFIDKDQYMTQLITPGVVLNEILGKEVKIWLGYLQTSFPEDYYVVWRGRVSQVNAEIGRVTLQFSDPNIGKRQQIFYAGKTVLSAGIDDVTTTIPVVSNTDFHQKIVGPDGTYDTSIRLYTKIDDEFIEYQQAGSEAGNFGTNEFLNVVRGARGTTAAAHDPDVDVDSFLEIEGHMIDIALKLQLSGWNGPYKEDQAIAGIELTGDALNPNAPNAIILPQNVDAVRDLGIAANDYITLTGSPNGGNNITVRAIAFQENLNTQNNIIETDGTLLAESGEATVIAIRSQYDTYPTTCGAKHPGWEVDVEGHVFYRNTYLTDPANSYRFFIDGPTASKSFIENELMLPVGAYCLTRQGKLSMGLTKPPIADARTITLNLSTVTRPESLRVQRGLNNRKYFNEINWEYDYDDEGEPRNLRKTLDTDSLNATGLSSVLPIKAKGARSLLDFDLIVARRERFLFGRYANASILLMLETNFGTGNQIEAGDVVLVQDNGELQIPNMITGERDFGTQLVEVIDRRLDIKTGKTRLTLQTGTGSLADDRYATISPSSYLAAGSTASRIIIKESFGEIFPGREQDKWKDYEGLRVVVHTEDWTIAEETTFIEFDSGNPKALLLSPALGFTPTEDMILDIAEYPDDPSPFDQLTYKTIHAFLNPKVDVVSGASDTVFDVDGADIAKFSVGRKILLHNDDYSDFSPEVEITDVTGNTITVDASIGFTPDNTHDVELIGFADFDNERYGGPYRFV